MLRLTLTKRKFCFCFKPNLKTSVSEETPMSMHSERRSGLKLDCENVDKGLYTV